MRKSAFMVVCFAFTLSACTTLPPSSPKQGENRITYLTPIHKAKPGNQVAFYSQTSSIQRPYRIIGHESVSRYNFIGMERASKHLDALMRSLAASMGGDAIINKRMDPQKVEGTVISFEKVLL